MKDNDLEAISIQPMSSRHFEIVRKELEDKAPPKVVEEAVRAIVVDLLAPAVACSQFAVTRSELAAALKTYSDTWTKYCEENDLVTEVFWLSPEVAERAKALESHELNRIEEQRKQSAASFTASSDTD